MRPRLSRRSNGPRPLLAYEYGAAGDNAQIVRVGQIHDTRLGAQDVRFRFVETGRILRSDVEDFAGLLDLRRNELCRTHWAVKDGSVPRPVRARVFEVFDVFVCYNSQERDAARALVDALRDRGLRVWIDWDQIAPGRRWQDELERIIGACGAAAICVGGRGIGPWEDAEIRGLLSRFVRDKGSTLP